MNKLGCVCTNALVGCKIRIEIKALIRVPQGANSSHMFFSQSLPRQIYLFGFRLLWERVNLS